MTVVQALAIAAAVCLFFRPARAYRAACELARRAGDERYLRELERERADELEALWGPE